LLLGYDITLTPKNERMHSFFAISFSDYDIGLVPPRNRVCCAANGILEQRGENPEPFTGFTDHRYEFTAGKNLPGKWRAVKYEVSPTNIKAFWRDDEQLGENGKVKQQWVKFADLDQDQILACVKRVDDLMASYKPPHIGQHAGWSPRRGIAIGCSRSSVAVRNVVITPTNP
jgi:hypothetical protein